MRQKTKVELENKTDRWRFTCPSGHRSWEPTNYHFWCQQCARTLSDKVEPEFEQLHDKKTGQLIARDEIDLEGYDE